MPYYFTRAGYKKFAERIGRLEAELKEMQSHVGEYSEVGGNTWHDNFSLESLRREMGHKSNEVKRSTLELNQGVVLDFPKSVDGVCLGCEVDIARDGKKETYKILGFGESDPDNYIIAYNAPLAMAIINKKPGYVTTQKIGSLEQTIEVIAVRPLSDDNPITKIMDDASTNGNGTETK
jgi:transcription elongation GreA/GreB family factor